MKRDPLPESPYSEISDITIAHFRADPGGTHYGQIVNFLKDVYNRKRIRSTLGYLTPFEFEQQQTSSLAVLH